MDSGRLVELCPALGPARLIGAAALDPTDEALDVGEPLHVRRSARAHPVGGLDLSHIGCSRARPGLKDAKAALERGLAQVARYDARGHAQPAGVDERQSVTAEVHSQAVLGRYGV